MVLGVCRRVTADARLAEDALQAAFLVVAVAGGTSAKTVASDKSPNAASMIFGTIDWR